MTTPTSTRVRRAASTAVAMVAACLAVGAAPSQAATPRLQVVDTAGQGIALSWNSVDQDTYLVKFATNEAMTTGVDTVKLRGTYFELTRTDGSQAVNAPRLKPGTKYWFKVLSLNSAGDKISGNAYSSKVSATTLPTGSPPELEPSRVRATVASKTSAHVSWRSRGPGVDYLVRYTSDPSEDDPLKWDSARFDTSGGVLTGLQTDTSYRIRVKVLAEDSNTGLSDYSTETATVTPVAGASPSLNIATYNVRKIYSQADWASRRGPVVANIRSVAPDVIGLQEATTINYGSKDQFEDLIDLLGSPYRLVSTGATSSGTRLAYNSDRVTASSPGVQQLKKLGSALRYAVWATFTDKLSGKKFFVITTHLEPGSQTSTTYNAVRRDQARQVVQLVNTHANGLPTMIVGDMNSGRQASSNAQYRVYTSESGYVDPLKNTAATFASGFDATPEHVIDAAYNSANQLQAKALRSDFPVGTYVDYIYVSPSIRVATWRTVVDVDTAGRFVGTIPSDHNMLQTQVHLP